MIGDDADVPPTTHPAALVVSVVDGDAGVRVGDRGHVVVGPVGTAAVGLPGRLGLIGGAAGSGALAPRAAAPDAFRIAIAGPGKRGPADRDYVRRRSRVAHPVAGVARRNGDHHAGVVVVGVQRGLAVEFACAIAVRDILRAHRHGRVDGGAEVIERVGIAFDEVNVAKRADCRHHVDVQRLFRRPVVGRGLRGRQWRCLPVLVDLLEAAVCGGAGRQAELGPVDREVRLGVRVVVGIDQSDGRATAGGRRRQAIGGLQLRRAVAGRGHKRVRALMRRDAGADQGQARRVSARRVRRTRRLIVRLVRSRLRRASRCVPGHSGGRARRAGRCHGGG